MKEEVCKGAAAMGLPSDMDMNILFNNMTQMVAMMRQKLDNTRP